MGDYTHADLLAAIDREFNSSMVDGTAGDDSSLVAHLDTLRAILDLAALWDEQQKDYPADWGGETAAAAVRLCAMELRAQVAYALLKMGAL